MTRRITVSTLTLVCQETKDLQLPNVSRVFSVPQDIECYTSCTATIAHSDLIVVSTVHFWMEYPGIYV